MSRLRALSEATALIKPHFDEGNDSGRYINFTFSTQSPKSVFELIRGLLNDADIGLAAKKSLIVTCEGDHGWDDYLLLHTFEASEPLDSL